MKASPNSIISLLAVSLAFTSLLSAQERPTGISVTGECLQKVNRDRGAVTISSSIVAPTAKESSRKTIEAHDAIKSTVQALKLSGLSASTSNYSVSQECEYNPKTSRPACAGYRTTISTRFETPNFTDLEQIIGIASQHGAQNVSQLEAFVSPALLKSERESCLEIATKNAHAKALKIATGAGVQLGKLISVHEEGTEAPQPFMGRGMVAMSASDSAVENQGPSIDVEPLDLRVAVTSVYAIQ
jgi:uncharacterized protein YggE